MSLDSPDIELPGPWTHRYVAANGARFHVCEAHAGEAVAGRLGGPLVLFLHGFPEFWWTWRHQLPAVADIGLRAVAMDLRGYGASDKTPRGYDPLTLADDVAGVIRALGARSAVLVGHGWGGYVAWSATARHPDLVRALCAVAAPHPTGLTRSPGSWFSGRALVHMAAMQVPWLPERRIAKGGYVAQHLARWSSPAGDFPSPEEAETYRRALALWPSPHCALEYHRWLFRSRPRADGRAFAAIMRRAVGVPVLHVSGSDDPAEPAGAVAASARHVTSSFTRHTIASAGHYPHEERPAEFTALLLRWLSTCAPTGGDGRR